MQGCFRGVYGYFIYLFNVILKCGFTGFEKLMTKQLSHQIEFTGDLDVLNKNVVIKKIRNTLILEITPWTENVGVLIQPSIIFGKFHVHEVDQ